MIASLRGTCIDVAVSTAVVEVGGVGYAVTVTPAHALTMRHGAEVFVRTVMGTAQASGLALHAAAARGLPVGLHTPSEVKAAITGYGNADKRQVQAMVARVLGLAEAPKPADAADALALAVCHAWRLGSPDAVSSGPGTLTPAQRAWRDAQAGAAGRSAASPLVRSGGARTSPARPRLGA